MLSPISRSRSPAPIPSIQASEVAPTPSPYYHHYPRQTTAEVLSACSQVTSWTYYSQSVPPTGSLAACRERATSNRRQRSGRTSFGDTSMCLMADYEANMLQLDQLLSRPLRTDPSCNLYLKKTRHFLSCVFRNS